MGKILLLCDMMFYYYTCGLDLVGAYVLVMN